MESAYREHRGLLFAALGRLAQQGYVAPPAEALDLIHDFFVEAWGGVAERYDERRASWQTYVYAAFVRFARPRIVRVHRQRAALMDPSDLDEILADQDDGLGQEPGAAVDLARMREAMTRLSADKVALLETWLNAGRASERELARAHGVTRYAVRQRLIEALGHVVAGLGATSALDPVGRTVALAMWRDRLSVDETVHRCGLSPQAVRNAYRRNCQHIEAALALTHRTSRPASGRTDSMSTDASFLAALVGRVRRPSAGDRELVLRDIAQHALPFVEYIAATPEPTVETWEGLPPDWLSEVFSAIAAGLGEAEHEGAMDPALFEADAGDRRAVGRAFVEALLPALETGAASGIDTLVQNLPARARGQRVDARLSEPDVVAGGDVARQLAAAGVTPVHLVLASDAVALMLTRAGDAGWLDTAAPLRAVRRQGALLHIGSQRDERWLARGDLVQEICDMALLDANHAAPLLDWLVEASTAVSELFAGFSASRAGGDVLLARRSFSDPTNNLFERWRGALLPDPALHMRRA